MGGGGGTTKQIAHVLAKLESPWGCFFLSFFLSQKFTMQAFGFFYTSIYYEVLH